MNCPVCKTERLSMMERQGIEIDYCPKCRGVWLDRGELDKIVERSSVELAVVAPGAVAASPAGAVAPQPYAAPVEYGQGGHRPRHEERYGSGHRRKSFLQELFD